MVSGPIRETGAAVVSIEVVTMGGAAAGVDFRISGDDVNVWKSLHPDGVRRNAPPGARIGVFSRSILRSWLLHPAGLLRGEGITLSLDRLVDRDGRVAISMPDVDTWTLAPSDLYRLLKLL